MKHSVKRREMKLDLYGEEFTVKFPTGRQLDQYLKDEREIINGTSDKSVFENTRALFEQLGIPGEKTDDLEVEHLSELAQIFLGQKKI